MGLYIVFLKVHDVDAFKITQSILIDSSTRLLSDSLEVFED
ncbi:MAG: hypothetical protein ACPLQS_01300 [Desulfurococcaceae archaeon]